MGVDTHQKSFLENKRLLPESSIASMVSDNVLYNAHAFIRFQWICPAPGSAMSIGQVMAEAAHAASTGRMLFGPLFGGKVHLPRGLAHNDSGQASLVGRMICSTTCSACAFVSAALAWRDSY